MTPPSKQPGLQKIPGKVLWLSTWMFLWYLGTYVLLPIPPVRSGLDESWRAFLTWAFEHHKQFGTEVIFTYGPWGFLLEPRGTISAYPWQILGRMTLSLAVSLGLSTIGASWIHSDLWRWLWAAAIVLFAEPTTLIPILLFLTALPSVKEFRGKWFVLLALAFAAGLAACTKFSCFLLVASLLPVMLFSKRVAFIVPVTATSFIVCWLAAAQAVENIPAFLSRSFEVSRGYASAMVAGSPHVELPLALLVCGLPLFRFVQQTVTSIDLQTSARVGWLCGCEYLVFRHGLIRSDPPHSFLAFVNVAIPLAILLMPLPGGTSLARSRLYNGLITLAVGLALWSARDTAGQRTALLFESIQLYPAYAQALSGPRARDLSIAAGGSSADVFPTELSYAIQKGISIHNRPVIQSYSAYTNELAEKNAAFLESRYAPETIYFHSVAYYPYHPTMGDNLAWRSLLTHYAPAGIIDGYLVLKRRERPASYRLKPLVDRDFLTNSIVEIPDVSGRLLWAEVTVQKSPIGRLLDLVYRNEPLTFRVVTAAGGMALPLLDENSARGFLLSPLVHTVRGLQGAFQPESSTEPLESVLQIFVQRNAISSIGFGANVKMRLYELVIGDSRQ